MTAPHKKYSFAVQSGDMRHEILCRSLNEKGHFARLIGDIGEEGVAEQLPEGGIVLAPKIGAEEKEILNVRGIEWIEYLTPRCEAAMAMITAENAVQVAMGNLSRTLFDTEILIIGYGKIGAQLARILRGMGCRVSVSARKPQALDHIEMTGMRALETGSLGAGLYDFGLIFNTVPAMVLPHERLRHINPDALIVDLASKPGGVDFYSAARLGLNVVHALGLPGKLSPVSAARAIEKEVFRLLEKGEAN